MYTLGSSNRWMCRYNRNIIGIMNYLKLKKKKRKTTTKTQAHNPTKKEIPNNKPLLMFGWKLIQAVFLCSSIAERFHIFCAGCSESLQSEGSCRRELKKTSDFLIVTTTTSNTCCVDGNKRLSQVS